MGKKRIAQLLEQLQDNQQQELQNAAAIFTVAQLAIDALEQTQPQTQPIALPAAAIDKAKLLQQYGSYNGCRKAAKQQGIKFNHSPSWQQLIAAFTYVEACQQVVQDYIRFHPNPELHGVSIELKLG